MSAHQILGRLHRYLGLTTAAFLVVAGLTGSVIAFHGELDAWLNPQFFHALPGAALPPSELVRRVEASDPHVHVAFVEVNAKPGRSAVLYVEPRPDETIDYNQVFADPSDGTLLGRRQYGRCCFQREAIIPFLYNLHRRLTLPGHWGDWLMGGVALLWLIDCFIAFALAVPRRLLNAGRWKTVLSIRLNASAFRAIFDFHRASGLWLWAVLAAVAVSSVYLNLGDIVRPVVSVVSPLAPTPYERAPPARDGTEARRSFDDILAASVSFAEKRGDAYTVTGIYLDREAGIYVTDFDNGGEVKAGLVWAAFDAFSGDLIGSQIPGEGSFGDIFIQIQFPLHSGQIAGLPGRILICLTGIVIAGLSITGVVIWWRKRLVQVRKRERHLAQ